MDRVPLPEMDEQCPDCGRNLVIRSGRFGRFISCSGFPECRYRRSFVNKTGALCPVCGGDLVERKTKQKKRVFYGCSNYPTCNFAIWERPVLELCPNCNGLMVVAKVGQDPVCYQEVIAVQRGTEEQPQQNGQVKTTRRTATTSRKKATGEDAAGTGEVEATTKTAARRKTTRTPATKTAKRTPATKKAPAKRRTTTAKTKADQEAAASDKKLATKSRTKAAK